MPFDNITGPYNPAEQAQFDVSRAVSNGSVSGMDPLEMMKMALMGQASDTLNAASEQEMAFRAQVAQRQRLKARGQVIQVGADEAVSERQGRVDMDMDMANHEAATYRRDSNRLLSKHGKSRRLVEDTVDTAQHITARGGQVHPLDVAGQTVPEFAETMAQVPWEMASAKSKASLERVQRENLPEHMTEQQGHDAWAPAPREAEPDLIPNFDPYDASMGPVPGRAAQEQPMDINAYMDELSFLDRFRMPQY